jgi:hypothetical protein
MSRPREDMLSHSLMPCLQILAAALLDSSCAVLFELKFVLWSSGGGMHWQPTVLGVCWFKHGVL